MELILIGPNKSFINYMRNHFLHEEGLNLLPIIETIHVDEYNKGEAETSYSLRYEQHTKATRKYIGNYKTIVKTKIPPALIRILEKQASQIKVDKKRGLIEFPQAQFSASSLDIDPKYGIFFQQRTS